MKNAEKKRMFIMVSHSNNERTLIGQRLLDSVIVP